MNSESCPFYGAAIGRGYSAYSTSGSSDNVRVTFAKDGLFLDVRTEYTGEVLGKLSFVIELATVSLGEFSLPNRNFDQFERKMLEMKRVLEDWEFKGDCFDAPLVVRG